MNAADTPNAAPVAKSARDARQLAKMLHKVRSWWDSMPQDARPAHCTYSRGHFHPRCMVKT